MADRWPHDLGLRRDDRLLVLGGSGWFGATLRAMVGSQVPVMATASRARHEYVRWDWSQIRDFAPTVVADFACLTPEHLRSVPDREYLRINSELLEQFSAAGSLPSVRAVVAASSGAAVQMPQTPYGQVKIAQETRARDMTSASRSVVVARAYSVSGPYVRSPRAYAFSDFILQARAGHVLVRSQRPTWRRYVSAADFLAVSAALACRGSSAVVDSGGPLLELADLATRVIEQVNPGADLTRRAHTDPTPSTYASDGSTWAWACEGLGYTPASLTDQIVQTARGLARA